MDEHIRSKRICVIGAGPSGCAVLRAFWTAKQQGFDIPEIVCFEKQEDLGGLWNYSWRTGIDKNGENVHNSMYRYLWSNGPKEALEFADYTFEEHFQKNIPSFPPRAVLFDYIKGRLAKTDVHKWCRFNHAVRDVAYSEESGKFTVAARDFTNERDDCSEFDYVFCCSGHFSVPNVPYFKGFETFAGRVLHAHDFRDAEEFRDKDILIIGTSYSAEDIASQCYKYGVKSVTCSYRTAPMGFHWPENFKEVPLLESIDYCSKTCHFKDGSTAEVDAIILCTGYKHAFPFMNASLRLETPNVMYPQHLYKGIFWEDNPKMMYLGMPDQWYTFNMFDAQAWYARDVVLGRIKLPKKPERVADDMKWVEREGNIERGDYKAAIIFQGDYVKSLITETDYCMEPHQVDAVNEQFFEWEDNKHKNIMTFRDCSHKSVMTGSQAPVHHTPWLEALDDSLECYLADGPDAFDASKVVPRGVVN